MTLISSLKLTTADPASMRIRGIDSMRRKLVDRVNDQIALVKAMESNKTYQRVKFRRTRDMETDEMVESPIYSRVRPWWNEAKDGSTLLWIKYGNQPLELQKGKSAIVLESKADLIRALETVRDGIRKGELDNPILSAVEKMRARFRK